MFTPSSVLDRKYNDFFFLSERSSSLFRTANPSREILIKTTPNHFAPLWTVRIPKRRFREKYMCVCVCVCVV